MAALLEPPAPAPYPVRYGLLRATGETLAGLRSCDAFDVLADTRGQVSAVLVVDPAGRNGKRPPLGQALRAARVALLERAALEDVARAVEAEADRGGFEIGLVVVRVSQTDARVEVLNAGLSPVACAMRGRTVLHAARSDVLGRGESAHPFEVVPLIWGSTWMIGSPGLTGGSLLAEATRDLCERLELGTRGAELASGSPRKLVEALIARSPEASRLTRDDATIVLLSADPHVRSDSRPR